MMINGNDESLNDEQVQTTQETSRRRRRSSDSNQGHDAETPPENTNPGDSEEEDPEDPEDPGAYDPADPDENVEDPGLIEPENGDGDGGNEDGNDDDVAPEEPNTGDDLDDDDGTDEETVINDLTLELTIVGQGTVTSSVYSDGVTETNKIVLGNNALKQGSQVTLTAIPAEDYGFTNWRVTVEEEVEFFTDDEITLLDIQKDLQITIHFEEKMRVTKRIL